MLLVIKIIRAFISNRRVGPVGIVFMDIVFDGSPQLPRGLKFIGIDQIILQGSEKAFGSNIVQCLSFSIHGNPGISFF